MRVKISHEHSAQIRAAYQLSNVRGKNLIKMFPQYSKAAIYKHAKKPLNGEPVFDKRKMNKGRPKKLTVQDERCILRNIPKLREELGNCTSKRVQLESGVTQVSNRTIKNILNKEGYHYLRSRKKGLLHASDLKARKRSCQKVRRKNLTQDFWNKGISLYLDGKSFEYKSNPHDQARAPRTRQWRKRGEGLKFRCTAKGKKEGCTSVNFMVAIAYGKGVVLCEQWEGTITGEKFASIVKRCLRKAFRNSANPKGKFFLMDGCPRQNSRVAMRAIEKVSESCGFASRFLEQLLTSSYIPLLLKPTRITPHTATLIDNIFSNDIEVIDPTLNGIIFSDISDHLPVVHVRNFESRAELYEKCVCFQKKF